MREEDKRQFARYTKESFCEVILGSEIYEGKIIDYSDGVGILIKNIPQLVKGAPAYVKILNHEIEFEAEVAWREEMGYHIRVGFKRLDNLKGNLKHYRLVDILLGLSKSRKTGILKITIGSIVKKIVVENGLKIFALSSNTNDHLGEYLVTHGKISLDDYTKASHVVEKTGQRLDQVLLNNGYLQSGELAQSVQHQVEEIIMSLFNINEGKFEFKEGPISKIEPIKLNISTANLIYKGIKRINSFPMVHKMSPPLDSVLNLSKNPIPLFQSLTLEYVDKKLLTTVNGINTLKNILTHSHSSNFETLKAIISLLAIGLITIKAENEAPQKVPLEVIFSISEVSSAEELELDKPEEDVAVTAETAEEQTEEDAAVSEETVEATSEQESNVQTTYDMTLLSNEHEAASEEYDEIPVESDTEEMAKELPEEDTAVSEETVEESAEQESIVKTNDNISMSPDEHESVSEEYDEISVESDTEEMAKELLEEDTAVSEETVEESAEQESIVKTNDNISMLPDEHESVSEEYDEIPVESDTEEMAKELLEEDTAVSEETVEESAEQESIVKTNDHISMLPDEHESVTEEYDEIPVESDTEETAVEQPVTDKLGYALETSSEPVSMGADMSSTTSKEGYVQVNDMLSNNVQVEVISSTVNAIEKPSSKKKWIISAFIIIILTGTIAFFVNKNITKPLSPATIVAIQKADTLPSAGNKTLEKTSAEITEDTMSYPTFRDDAIKKLLNE